MAEPRFRPRKAGECCTGNNEKSAWCQLCTKEWWMPSDTRSPFLCPPCAEIKYCCNTMETHVLSDEVAVTCYSSDSTFGIQVIDGGNSIIKIAYCPWCGVGLV